MVKVNALRTLQCFETACWPIGKASSQAEACSDYP